MYLSEGVRLGQGLESETVGFRHASVRDRPVGQIHTLGQSWIGADGPLRSLRGKADYKGQGGVGQG